MVQALQLKPLELYVDPVAKPVDTRLGALMSYWRAKRQGTAALPTRGDIRPGELISHLPSLIMLDVEDGGKDAGLCRAPFRHRAR